MKPLLIAIAIIAAGIFVFTSIGSEPPEVFGPTVTQPRVMPNIEAESDCDILQAIFDNAEDAGDAARDRGDLALASDFTDAMRRADSRMEAVGCYG